MSSTGNKDWRAMERPTEEEIEEAGMKAMYALRVGPREFWSYAYLLTLVLVVMALMNWCFGTIGMWFAPTTAMCLHFGGLLTYNLITNE